MTSADETGCWTARSKAEKQRARRLEKAGKARVVEELANYVSKRGRLVVSRELYVTPLESKP
jgi:hypothetical protein